MEISSALIILIFVVAIFSGMPKNEAPQKSLQHLTPKPQVAASFQFNNLPSSTFTFIDTFEAAAKESIGKYIAPRAKRISSDEASLLIDSIMKYSKEYDINPKIVTALIDRESGFNPKSISSSNAQGLAQLLPSTAKDIGIQNPFDIEEGTKGAALYLKMMMDKWRGLSDQVVLALASYAEGCNQIFRRDRAYSSKTAQYVKDILDRYEQMN